MSSTTPTSYTSAAMQTTPLTSQPAMSASASAVHSLPAKSSRCSQTIALALCPRHVVNTHESALDSVFSSITKSAALIIGASIERQLMLSATNDIFTAHIFLAILWFVFGGHRKLFADDLDPPVVPPDGSRRVTSNVESWLGKLRSLSNLTAEVVIPPELCVQIARIDSAHDENKGVAIEVCDGHLTVAEPYGIADVVAANRDNHDVFAREDSVATEAVYDADEALLDLGRAVKVFSGCEDLAQPEHAAPADEKLLRLLNLDEWASKAGPTLDTGKLTEQEPWLAALLEQHNYPVFVLGGGDNYCQEAKRFKHNLIYPIISKNIPAVVEDDFSSPGRPVDDDTLDIEFLYDALCDRLPEYVLRALKLHDSEYWNRYRCWKTWSNLCREMLILEWHTLNSPDKVKTLDDVMAIDEARVKKFRPACPMGERKLHGPDSPYRPYLQDWEEYKINCGSGAYREHFIYTGNPCPVFQRLKDDPTREKIASDQSPTLSWLEEMDESQLDPNSYDDCECTREAVKLLWEYRNENEHGYDSSSHTDFLYFPSRLNAPGVHGLCEICSGAAIAPEYTCRLPPGF